MPWTSTKTAKKKNLANATVSVTVELRNGDQVTTRDIFADNLTEAVIADKVARQIESLEAMEAAFDAIVIGEPVTPVKIEPDAKAIAYETAYSKLKAIEQEVASKIIPVDAPAYLAAIQAVKDAKAALATPIK